MAVNGTTAEIQQAIAITNQVISLNGMYFQDNSQIVVCSVDVLGVVTERLLTTHYTLTGAGDFTYGELTVVGGTVGDIWFITRDVPITQLIGWVQQGGFSMKNLETATDKLTLIAQQHESELDRTPKFAAVDTLTDAMTVIPSLANQSNVVKLWNGSAMVYIETGGNAPIDLDHIRASDFTSARAIDHTTLSNGDLVFINDRVASGDGGGGIFEWVSTNTETDNGTYEGVNLALTSNGASAGRLHRKDADLGVTHLLWFGPTRDGVTDDSTPIANAVSIGERTFFPEGVYVAEDILITGDCIIEGPQATIKLKTNTGTATNAGFIRVNDPTVCDIKLKKIDGNNTGGTLTHGFVVYVRTKTANGTIRADVDIDEFDDGSHTSHIINLATEGTDKLSGAKNARLRVGYAYNYGTGVIRSYGAHINLIFEDSYAENFDNRQVSGQKTFEMVADVASQDHATRKGTIRNCFTRYCGGTGFFLQNIDDLMVDNCGTFSSGKKEDGSPNNSSATVFKSDYFNIYDNQKMFVRNFFATDTEQSGINNFKIVEGQVHPRVEGCDFDCAVIIGGKEAGAVSEETHYNEVLNNTFRSELVNLNGENLLFLNNKCYDSTIAPSVSTTIDNCQFYNGSIIQPAQSDSVSRIVDSFFDDTSYVDIGNMTSAATLILNGNEGGWLALYSTSANYSNLTLSAEGNKNFAFPAGNTLGGTRDAMDNANILMRNNTFETDAWVLVDTAALGSNSQYFRIGDTIEGQTSGATATINGVINGAGLYSATGTAELWLTDIVGTFTSGETCDAERDGSGIGGASTFDLNGAVTVARQLRNAYPDDLNHPVSDDATPDIETFDLWETDGSTITVTRFDGNYDKDFTVVVATNDTIQDNANVVLRAGADLVGPAVARFRKVGGISYEM